MKSGLVLILLASSSVGALAEADLSKAVMPFLNQHCFECHDEDVQKGDLDLVSTPFDPTDPYSYSVWQRVFERVRDGEMPPEKKPRPKAKEAESFMALLEKPLMEVQRKAIAENGRVQSRRLTRVEYENTLHDLLGIDIPLTQLLPDDPFSHGFQTVADGQQLSHHQLGRYLNAADIALEEAFDRALGGDNSAKRFVTPAQLAKRGSGNYRGPDLRDGRSISWPIRLQYFGRMPATTVPESGWYRITLKDVHAINPSEDGAVWGTLRAGAANSAEPLMFMVGLVEATEEPKDLTFKTWIEKGHMLELKPNDATLKVAPSGAQGGNVSFKGRDLEKEGFAGIANRGIEIERIHVGADRKTLRRNLFGDEELGQWKDKKQAGLRSMVNRFARRAFRRPVSEEQVAPYHEIGLAALKEGESLPNSLQIAYRAILCSPRFLTFVEEPGKLDDFAIASRLSYALWVSMPDWTLTKLAIDGKLKDPATIAAQVERMLGDRRAERFLTSFTDQWLNLKDIDFTTPDPRQFRTWDLILQQSMLEETRTYVREMVRKNLSVTHLIDSEFAFLNGRLARHYDLEVPLSPGAGLQRVSLPEDPDQVRGGLVTQGAVLKVTADGSVTSPVIRGVFMNERILGVHVPPPPPGVPAIEPDIRGAVSIRDELAKHSESASCISCHLSIDPPGFALENFDPVGGWRTNYGIGGKGSKVTAFGETKEGEKFDGLIAWKALYGKRKKQLAHGFAAQFITYSTGAAPMFSDGPDVDRIVERSAKSGYGLRSLIKAVATSPIFLNK